MILQNSEIYLQISENITVLSLSHKNFSQSLRLPQKFLSIPGSSGPVERIFVLNLVTLTDHIGQD
ncbi:hypothetical protein BpHYR1_045681 [Brachionus plicatilis]|uniref:Uncharacterized protein n=1 Tax=Brachionus plicatilis TaxID=10195 RepID=A0A3M7QGB7_BRAPC|nr:hypothetical protein BpHYR1_045681 [Brachionus plicatilis]